MFQFKYTLSEHDFFEYNKYHAFNSPANRKTMLISRFVVPLIFVVCGVLSGLLLGSFMEDVNISYICYGAATLVTLFWIIFFKWIMTKQMRKNLSRLKKKGKLPYQSDIALCFEDDAIVEITENGESKIKYSAIERLVVSDTAIYIYMNVQQALLIPSSVLTDEEHRNELLRFIEEKRVAAR